MTHSYDFLDIMGDVLYDKTFIYLCIVCLIVVVVTLVLDPVNGPHRDEEPHQE